MTVAGRPGNVTGSGEAAQEIGDGKERGKEKGLMERFKEKNGLTGK